MENRSEQFEGKVAFITGGGTGIGRSAALAFAREGANIALVRGSFFNGLPIDGLDRQRTP